MVGLSQPFLFLHVILFAFHIFFRIFAIENREDTPSRQKKEKILLFCARLFVSLHPKSKVWRLLALPMSNKIYTHMDDYHAEYFENC